MLRVGDFSAFFREVHGFDPFPWQRLLLERVATEGRWPSTLDLPTGTGKTATIDIALYHLALEAHCGVQRRAPVRVAFVVDRRLVVDDAFERARKLEAALRKPPGPATAAVVHALKALAADGPPLVARRLRGGIAREDDWARTPAQPTVLCSTVDQVGSRLLFRGYGVSNAMKPVHAGLIGADCLILLDEAHLAEPFRQTLEWVSHYRGPNWRESKHASPWGMVLLTATPGQTNPDHFVLDQDRNDRPVGGPERPAVSHDHFVLDQDCNDRDSAHPILQPRLCAKKPVRLVQAEDEAQRQQVFVREVHRALDAGAQAIGVVVNRVARARSVFELLRGELDADHADLILMIGPARPVQRDELASLLAPIRTGAARTLPRPLVVVATQCIEAGVDIDLDALFSEAAPLDCLRQRVGRLNRAGRPITPLAAIVAIKEEVGARSTDPVYAQTIPKAWSALDKHALRRRNEPPVVEFGLSDFAVPMDPPALSPKPDAPVLMPAHLDLLAQTSPIPAVDPDVARYLHGPSRQPDAIAIVWRGDLELDAEPGHVQHLFALMPPRSAEAIELPLWAVRRWLDRDLQPLYAIADIATDAPAEGTMRGAAGRRVFRWRGLDEGSHWIDPAELRAGDTIVVPATYGGVDGYGWHPECVEPVADLADAAAAGYRGRRYAVRVAPGLIGTAVPTHTLARLLAAARNEPWSHVRDALAALDLPDERKSLLAKLDRARGHGGRPRVEVHFDVYGLDPSGQPRGVVFVAWHGLVDGGEAEEGRPNSTEDDASGSIQGFAQSLTEHSEQVEARAEVFAGLAGLPPERIADLGLAGFLHDAGKRDQRFQRWMHYGDPLGADPEDEATILAKSGRSLPAVARDMAGLPPHWRHEALSVRLARAHERLQAASDPDLVLWLVGTHHGWGRPLYPHEDPTETAPDVGPQAFAFDWRGLDWAALYDVLKARYGVWELARMEAILRLADHRASEDAAATRGDG